jgi:hypothetical protein
VVAAAKQKAELQKQEEKAELAKQKAELQKQEVLVAKTKETTRQKVAAVAKKAKNKLVVSAAKAQTLPSKLIRAATIILDVSPAKKKSKVSTPDLIPTFCSNQNNHAGKVCSFDSLKEERDIHYYGITGDSDEYGEPPICGNQCSNCCLQTKESWKKSFSKKKPTL